MYLLDPNDMSLSKCETLSAFTWLVTHTPSSDLSPIRTFTPQSEVVVNATQVAHPSRSQAAVSAPAGRGQSLPTPLPRKSLAQLHAGMQTIEDHRRKHSSGPTTLKPQASIAAAMTKTSQAGRKRSNSAIQQRQPPLDVIDLTDESQDVYVVQTGNSPVQKRQRVRYTSHSAVALEVPTSRRSRDPEPQSMAAHAVPPPKGNISHAMGHETPRGVSATKVTQNMSDARAMVHGPFAGQAQLRADIAHFSGIGASRQEQAHKADLLNHLKDALLKRGLSDQPDLSKLNEERNRVADFLVQTRVAVLKRENPQFANKQSAILDLSQRLGVPLQVLKPATSDEQKLAIVIQTHFSGMYNEAIMFYGVRPGLSYDRPTCFCLHALTIYHQIARLSTYIYEAHTGVRVRPPHMLQSQNRTMMLQSPPSSAAFGVTHQHIANTQPLCSTTQQYHAIDNDYQPKQRVVTSPSQHAMSRQYHNVANDYAAGPPPTPRSFPQQFQDPRQPTPASNYSDFTGHSRPGAAVNPMAQYRRQNMHVQNVQVHHRLPYQTVDTTDKSRNHPGMNSAIVSPYQPIDGIYSSQQPLLTHAQPVLSGSPSGFQGHNFQSSASNSTTLFAPPAASNGAILIKNPGALYPSPPYESTDIFDAEIATRSSLQFKSKEQQPSHVQTSLVQAYTPALSTSEDEQTNFTSDLYGNDDGIDWNLFTNINDE